MTVSNVRYIVSLGSVQVALAFIPFHTTEKIREINGSSYYRPSSEFLNMYQQPEQVNICDP